jgi:hypothetical protein
LKAHTQANIPAFLIDPEMNRWKRILYCKARSTAIATEKKVNSFVRAPGMTKTDLHDFFSSALKGL